MVNGEKHMDTCKMGSKQAANSLDAARKLFLLIIGLWAVQWIMIIALYIVYFSN
jgi:hypothetical protein